MIFLYQARCEYYGSVCEDKYRSRSSHEDPEGFSVMNTRVETRPELQLRDVHQVAPRDLGQGDLSCIDVDELSRSKLDVTLSFF